MQGKRKYIVLITAVFFLSSFFQGMRNDAEEYSVKAAFMYNFTKFVEWDKSETSPTFIIGIIGDSPIYKPLQDLAATKTIDNKKIEVMKCNATSPSNCMCQILFVPESVKNKDFQSFITELNATKNVLIISESKGFLNNGSAINFLVVDNHIKFEINISSLNKYNLKASSQLLKLASNIQY